MEIVRLRTSYQPGNTFPLLNKNKILKVILIILWALNTIISYDQEIICLKRPQESGKFKICNF
jgi:hypothetical protein